LNAVGLKSVTNNLSNYRLTGGRAGTKTAGKGNRDANVKSQNNIYIDIQHSKSKGDGDYGRTSNFTLQMKIED